MSGYLLTPAADADLDEIWRYVSEASGVLRANVLEDELHAAMHRLGRSPGMGHSRHDLADEVTCFWAVHKFLIVYRPQTRPVQVIRVLHGARDVQSILGEDPGDYPS